MLDAPQIFSTVVVSPPRHQGRRQVEIRSEVKESVPVCPVLTAGVYSLLCSPYYCRGFEGARSGDYSESRSWIVPGHLQVPQYSSSGGAMRCSPTLVLPVSWVTASLLVL